MAFSNVCGVFLLVGGDIAVILLVTLVGIWCCLFCYFIFSNWIFWVGFLTLFFLMVNLVFSSILMIFFLYIFVVVFYTMMLLMYCSCFGVLLFFSVVWISLWQMVGLYFYSWGSRF